MKPDVRRLRQKFAAVWPMLDERTRRLMAASEALVLAYGGVSLVHRACGLSRKAIAKGIREIRSGTLLEPGRFGRHQEEGPGRQLRQRRPTMASGEAGPPRAGPRFPESRCAARVSLRHLRRGAQRGLRQRGDGP